MINSVLEAAERSTEGQEVPVAFRELVYNFYSHPACMAMGQNPDEIITGTMLL